MGLASMLSGKKYEPVPTYDLLGVSVSALTPEIFLQQLVRWHSDSEVSGKGSYVCFRDVHGVVRAQEDAALADAHSNALMNAPDGKPLVWMGRRHGHRTMSQVCGPEMMLEVCKLGVDLGWRHVFYGGTDAVLEDLRATLLCAMPDLAIVEMIAPPFRALTSEEHVSYLTRIRDSRPHFVWVGIGSPKQELWMRANAESIPGAISMGVGAAFDMHSNRVARAPGWARALGLEWLVRAFSEPKRLGPRYAKVVPAFIWEILKSEISRR